MYIKAVRKLANDEVCGQSFVVYWDWFVLIDHFEKKDPTRADLKEIPAAVVMSVLMAATTSAGQKLSDPEWQSVERACDLADRLEKVRTKVKSIIDSPLC